MLPSPLHLRLQLHRLQRLLRLGRNKPLHLRLLDVNLSSLRHNLRTIRLRSYPHQGVQPIDFWALLRLMFQPHSMIHMLPHPVTKRMLDRQPIYDFFS